MLGGSTAWGYGVPWDQAFPAYLERKLNAARSSGGRVSVINLAFNNEGAYSFRYTLRDYAYLDYDAVLFYTGYNDLGGPNTQVFRHQSPVFRLTGFLPLLPSVFAEKAAALRRGRYGDKTVFTPTLGKRVTATGLDAAATVVRSLERQVGRLSAVPAPSVPPPAPDCPERWHHYCASLHTAIEDALSSGKTVLVVTQPYVSDLHIEQQRVMVGMLRGRFGEHSRLHHVNLGPVVDLRDPALAFDRMHLHPPANERMAERLVEPVLRALGASARPGRAGVPEPEAPVTGSRR